MRWQIFKDWAYAHRNAMWFVVHNVGVFLAIIWICWAVTVTNYGDTIRVAAGATIALPFIYLVIIGIVYNDMRFWSTRLRYRYGPLHVLDVDYERFAAWANKNRILKNTHYQIDFSGHLSSRAMFVRADHFMLAQLGFAPTRF